MPILYFFLTSSLNLSVPPCANPRSSGNYQDSLGQHPQADTVGIGLLSCHTVGLRLIHSPAFFLFSSFLFASICQLTRWCIAGRGSPSLFCWLPSCLPLYVKSQHGALQKGFLLPCLLFAFLFASICQVTKWSAAGRLPGQGRQRRLGSGHRSVVMPHSGVETGTTPFCLLVCLYM